MSVSVWIEPGRLLDGAYPHAVGELIDAGVSLAVDLTQDGELTPYAHLLPARVSHGRLPIPDFTCADAAQMRETLDAIDAELARGGTVFVRCRGGCGRTGTVVGCWLVGHGLTGEEALQRLADRRPETDEQRQLVRGCGGRGL